MTVARLVVPMVLLVACTGSQQQTGEPATDAPPTPMADATTSAADSPPPTPTPPPAPESSPTEPTPVAGNTSPADPGPVDTEVAAVAEGLEVPWAVAFAPDGRVFVTERDSGRVLELGENGGAQEVHRFDIDPGGEGGLLGLAASPQFTGDGLLYAYYSTPADNRVVRFAPGGDEEVVLDGIPKSGIHNGGRLAFGPDGKLYAGTGDASQSGLAQDPGSLAGKILRMNADGTVPDDNPFDRSLVWSFGHRNVQGLAWDSQGRMYASEFGPGADDEINRIQPGGNYGWPEVTGRTDGDRFTEPILVRQPPEASWSGAAILVDAAIPQWEGDLFVAGLRGQRLWHVRLDDDGSVADAAPMLVDEYGRLRFAVQAPDGSLWVGTSNRDGRGDPADGDDRILRIGPPQG